MNRTKVLILAFSVLIVAVLGIFVYKYYPVYEAYTCNKQISVSGVKFLMTETELKETIDEQVEPVYVMGGTGWRFSHHKILVIASSVGLFKDKVSYIDTENPSHNIYGIRVGDNRREAVSVLESKGFRKSEVEDIYEKGNIQIQLFGRDRISRLRITVNDPSLKGVVF